MMNIVRLLLLAAASLCLIASPAGQAAGTAKATGQSKAAPPTSSTKTQLIDINSASADELDQLPGIGPAFAKKIIANRPYRGKNELVQKNIVPPSTYEKIKDKIVARQK
jgi:competence protein ComEA